RLPNLPLWGMAALYEPLLRPAAVDVVSGACLLIKRQVFERVGGFSSQYFMYSEDVDLCHKVKRAGLKTCLVPAAEVVHHGGGSSSLTPVSQFAAVLMRESRYQFFRTTRGALYASLFRLTTGASALARM